MTIIFSSLLSHTFIEGDPVQPTDVISWYSPDNDPIGLTMTFLGGDLNSLGVYANQQTYNGSIYIAGTAPPAGSWTASFQVDIYATGIGPGGGAPYTISVTSLPRFEVGALVYSLQVTVNGASAPITPVASFSGGPISQVYMIDGGGPLYGLEYDGGTSGTIRVGAVAPGVFSGGGNAGNFQARYEAVGPGNQRKQFTVTSSILADNSYIPPAQQQQTNAANNQASAAQAAAAAAAQQAAAANTQAAAAQATAVATAALATAITNLNASISTMGALMEYWQQIKHIGAERVADWQGSVKKNEEELVAKGGQPLITAHNSAVGRIIADLGLPPPPPPPPTPAPTPSPGGGTDPIFVVGGGSGGASFGPGG
jgi:hypothetical protein